MAYRDRDLYQEVTDRILAQLEKGCVPWVKPWSSLGTAAGAPVNASTNRPYSGCNVLLLWAEQQDRPEWTTARFLTFKQATELGGHVKKGEHGTKVYFWKAYLAKDRAANAEPDDVVKALVMKEYTVFNVAQCEGLPERAVYGEKLRVRNPNTRDELADEYIKATGADVREGAGEAFYVPSRDFISMPRFEAFNGADAFYNTVFHELTHWTGAKQRLDRTFSTKKEVEGYATEELVAELGAAFQCAEFGFDNDRIQTVGYIDHFIKALKNDKRVFFAAASKAQKAVDFLRNAINVEQQEAA
jgi:antirestriction protein ArdC